MDDDVRLDKIAFTESRIQSHDLSQTQCAVILANFFLNKRCKPKDSLLKEELMPYLDVILSNPNTNWCLKSIALTERTKLEKNDKRSIERALMQIQLIVDHLWKSSSNNLRMSMIYSCKPPPFWILEYELLQVLISVGSIKTGMRMVLSQIAVFHKDCISFSRSIGLRTETEAMGRSNSMLSFVGS